MTIIYSFIFCGLLCVIGEILLDNTKLTPGHVTSILVVVGAFLGMINIYDKIVDFVGVGANIPITSFGNTLINSAYIGFKKYKYLGLFSNMLSSVSLGITSSLIFSFIFTLISKPKD